MSGNSPMAHSGIANTVLRELRREGAGSEVRKDATLVQACTAVAARRSQAVARQVRLVWCNHTLLLAKADLSVTTLNWPCTETPTPPPMTTPSISAM